MALCIREPRSPEEPVLLASKLCNYPKDAPVSVGPHTILFACQNGVHAGFVTTGDGEKKFFINNTFFSGLKKPAFSKEYKNVTLYWYHRVNETYQIDEEITTCSGCTAHIKCAVAVDLFAFSFDDFYCSLRNTEIKSNADTLILSAQSLKKMVCGMVVSLMRRELESAAADGEFAAGLPAPETDFRPVGGQIAAEVVKIGPSGSVTILPHK